MNKSRIHYLSFIRSIQKESSKVMLKTILHICFLSLLIITFSCSFNQSESLIDDAVYDNQLHIIGVDYPETTNTSLQQVIHFSDIRKRGYGVLLNIDSSYSQKEIDDLKLELQKLDINAIHSYDIGLQDSLKNSIRVALEGAMFIWLIENDDLNLDNSPIGYLLKSLRKNSISRNLLITDNQQYFKLKEFLSNH